MPSRIVRRKNEPAGQATALHPLLHLQQTVGNQAVGQLIQAKLKVGQPGDKYEQEADRVADAVMRMPQPHLAAGAAISGRSQDARIQRACPAYEDELRRQVVEEEEEEEALQAQEIPGRTTEVAPEVQAHIHAVRGGGQPLPESVRASFEPRFGRDFSQVRIHTDPPSADLARSLKARAFTLGHHVVFGSGQYEPQTSDGRRLLAHELTHVVQQGRADARREGAHEPPGPVTKRQHAISRMNSGRSGETLQRAIEYRQVTWKDFKGAVPQGRTTHAWTKAFIETFGRWNAKAKTTNTKKPCTISKRKITEYKVKAFIPPTVFNRVRARMDQDQSWAIRRIRDVPGYCKSQVQACTQHFTKAFKPIEKSCAKNVADCQKEFDRGATSWTITIDNTRITVPDKKRCATDFLKRCRKLLRQKVFFSLQVLKTKKVFAIAKTKKDCKGKKFSDDCKDFLQKLSAKLLAHEQGHFDLAKVMADKTKAALKAKAATFVVEETKCGKGPAKKAAFAAFGKLNAGAALQEIYDDGNDGKNKADEDYDNDTDHGLKDKEQAAWKQRIADGLKAYPVPKTRKQQGKQTTP